MLIDDIVEFCDKKYVTFGKKCGRSHCNHPSGECSGSCYDCLYQIHFPERFTGDIKKLYDCPKMLYHYVCQYSYLYTTELLCAFDEEADYLSDYPYFHIVSLGCGGCADLMAFEYFYDGNNLDVPIAYFGVDINELWRPINNRIAKYCDGRAIKYKVRYDDAFKYFRQGAVKDANVIVLSYLISYLYNTNQIHVIDIFLSDLVRNMIQKKKKDQKLLLIINDVNSYRRGRNYFDRFKRKVEAYNLTIVNCKYRYFDTGNLYDGQKIGSAYDIHQCCFDIPHHIRTRYHAETKCKQTIQMLLEVI